MPFVDIRYAVANRGPKEVRALRGDLRPGWPGLTERKPCDGILLVFWGVER